MTTPRIYVETTIPSAYYTSRPGAEMSEKRLCTRKWWSEAAQTCELVSSPVVFRELARGKSAHVPSRLALIMDLTLLPITAEAMATAEVYVRRKIMPADPYEDALHLALASHHNCGVLVTWNYRHLANGNKFNQIRRINAELGLPFPLITTPEQLSGGTR
jgi:predicted nucleic acid-binding protein